VLVLEWRETARADLLAIVDYISDDNPDAAQRLKDEIKAKAAKLYSSNTNISFFHSADEFETIRQQGTQFALIFARISEEFLTSGFEFGERFVVSVIQGFLLEEFPEAFDQIQIRRIGREEYELDA